MQIAQVLAGYSLGEADLLRRAMGKKKKEEMDAQRARFVEGAMANGVSAEQADFIFNLVDKFAGYGFNKSHAAAYALVAWQTAWLKHHHPAAFYAATMAYDMHLTDRLAIYVADMTKEGVPLLPPSINHSGADFILEDIEGDAGGQIGVRYALGALKGVGRTAMEAIVAEREANGPFASLDDFAGRINPQQLNRRQLEALAAAGAFDCLGLPRAAVHAAAAGILAAASRAADGRATGQGGLFENDAGVQKVPLDVREEWPLAERLRAAHASYGFWFGGHPVEAFRAVLDDSGVVTGAEALARRGEDGTRALVQLAGIVEDFRWRVPQGKGPDRRYMMADCSDQGGTWGMTVFEADTQQVVEEAKRTGEPLLMDVELKWREGDEEPRLTARAATPLAAMMQRTRAHIFVEIGADGPADLAKTLADHLPRGGRNAVTITLALAEGARVDVDLGMDFLMQPGLLDKLEGLPGVLAVWQEALKPRLRLVA